MTTVLQEQMLQLQHPFSDLPLQKWHIIMPISFTKIYFHLDQIYVLHILFPPKQTIKFLYLCQRLDHPSFSE